MDLAWDLDREGDVSLVRCRVRNDDAVPRRVRIESRLDAPVLPPRRGGVPEEGWDETGVTLRLDPGERRALGFAARAPPADPPVEVAEVAAVDSTAESGGVVPSEGGGRAASATAAALRRLGDHRPPRDVVAGGETELGEADPKGDSSDSDRAAGTGTDAADIDEPAADSDAPLSPSGETTRWFDPVDEQLDAVEERIDKAERLTDADLATATEAVAEADGVEGLSGLDERVAADAARLRDLSERASALATRAEATDAPVEALERLA
ncbi:DUF7857 domain-containing protein [Halorubrum salsamenti]|uniref:DUF7857 domain-containing protein n=1 Tax=Halorubrum salsamenti TaxID=2583990 RepID=UPI0011A11FA4|nr:hypothetical protein [Halorubrum salsamenti]